MDFQLRKLQCVSFHHINPAERLSKITSAHPSPSPCHLPLPFFPTPTFRIQNRSHSAQPINDDSLLQAQVERHIILYEVVLYSTPNRILLPRPSSSPIYALSLPPLSLSRHPCLFNRLREHLPTPHPTPQPRTQQERPTQLPM